MRSAGLIKLNLGMPMRGITLALTTKFLVRPLREQWLFKLSTQQLAAAILEDSI